MEKTGRADSALRLFAVKENPVCAMVPKSLRCAISHSAAAVCLPLMREVASPEGKTEGEKPEEKQSLPQSAWWADSPLVRGGLGWAHDRIRL